MSAESIADWWLTFDRAAAADGHRALLKLIGADASLRDRAPEYAVRVHEVMAAAVTMMSTHGRGEEAVTAFLSRQAYTKLLTGEGSQFRLWIRHEGWPVSLLLTEPIEVGLADLLALIPFNELTLERLEGDLEPALIEEVKSSLCATGADYDFSVTPLSGYATGLRFTAVNP